MYYDWRMAQIEGSESIKLQGTLENFYILGNTARAEVIVKGRTIIVDHLNRFEGSRFALKEEVGLVIERKVCTTLSH